MGKWGYNLLVKVITPFITARDPPGMNCIRFPFHLGIFRFGTGYH